MAKAQSRYVCQACGTVTPKWQGQCAACNAWNSVVEEAAAPHRPGSRTSVIALTSLAETVADAPRLTTGIGELDRTLGGGLVPASAVLVGGDPGIGKSTLLLDAAARLARAGRRAFYISGEEAANQIRLRAQRMALADAPLHLGIATKLNDILATLDQGLPPEVVVIDSIQTLHADELESAPGTVAQVRATAQALIRFAKARGCALILVGHVTKDGQIAGPRVLEHMVDTVLYFEGERGHPFRILRAVKNRFGGTDEIGVFEMTSAGLREVANPSELFLSDRAQAVSGSVVFAGIEGSRPLLVEIQALVSPTPAANPRRTVVGWDAGRLATVIAVLDARAGLGLGGHDVYLNVAGGLRIGEPAADLAVAAALASALSGKAVDSRAVVFGEIALSGEVRDVPQGNARLKEAQKLGFKRALLPRADKIGTTGLDLCEIKSVQALVDSIMGSA
ncbi:MAG: DNA repair protein RadA [Pseudomonadota bacterium]